MSNYLGCLRILESELRVKEEKLARRAVLSLHENSMDVRNVWTGMVASLMVLALLGYAWMRYDGWRACAALAAMPVAVTLIGHFSQPVTFFIVRWLVKVEKDG